MKQVGYFLGYLLCVGYFMMVVHAADLSDNLQRCLRKNEPYLMQCASEASEVLNMEENEEEVSKECLWVSALSNCITARAIQMCGDEAAATFEMMFKVLNEIEEACMDDFKIRDEPIKSLGRQHIRNKRPVYRWTPEHLRRNGRLKKQLGW